MPTEGDKVYLSITDPTEPQSTEKADVRVQQECGLCLSGGGYRAMLFHAGALWALNDLGWLPRFATISSVSGGSITAGVLAMGWSGLKFNNANCATNFESSVITPIRRLASKTIDAKGILWGIFTPGSVSDKIQGYYKDVLFGNTSLQDLSDEGPRFVFNATNLQSGVLWRFSKYYMADWRVGLARNPDVPLALAVAASSAFPPFLSPATLDLCDHEFEANSGENLQVAPYTKRAVLSDGGVYDNLGMEPVYKRYETLIVSDAGGQMQPSTKIARGWARHSLRVLNVIDNQVRSLRKRMLIAAFVRRRQLVDAGHAENSPMVQEASRLGTYFSIRGNARDYLPDGQADLPVLVPHSQTQQLANLGTRLKATPDITQERLINWGYAMTRLAMRRWVDVSLPELTGFPYPGAGVG